MPVLAILVILCGCSTAVQRGGGDGLVAGTVMDSAPGGSDPEGLTGAEESAYLTSTA